MGTEDAAELIAELKEQRSEHEHEERFNRVAALIIATMAAVLAIGGLGGGNATDDMVISTIRASDTWAFYQAKTMRQTMYEIELAKLEAQPAQAGAERAALEARIADAKATIARYEDEPDPAAPDDSLRGEGKQQLTARAQAFEAARDTAMARDDNFDLAEVALQLALVLGSVAILASNRTVLVAASVLGAVGTVLTLNGFLLVFSLPF
jgi:hypothetical protein